jgi:hypothetical protein
MLSGGCTGGDGGAALGPAREGDVGFDGGVSAGIEDFAGCNRDDLGHIAPMGRKAVLSCMGQTLGCGIDPVRLCDDAVLQAVVEFCATVYGNGRSGGGMNGCYEFVGGVLHLLDSSKVGLPGRKRWRDSTKVVAMAGYSAQQSIDIAFGRAYIPGKRTVAMLYFA